MKKICTFLTLTMILYFGFTQKTQAQNEPEKKPWLLMKLIENEQGEIASELSFGPFFSLYKDQQRDYRWHSTNIGIRANGSLGIFLVYSELFYENYELEHTAFVVPFFERSKEFKLETGGGIRVPVEIGETGIKLEGELTTPFEEFRPAIEVKLGWENKNKKFGFSFGNKIVVEYASLLNPTGLFFYRIY